MGRLNKLGVKYGTDKSRLYHDYLDFYEEVFEECGLLNRSNITFMEIGVLGGASIKMWRDFLKNAEYVIGVDINESDYVDGVILHKVDAYGEEGFNLLQIYRPDILIDDGSHNSNAIIALANFLTSEENISWFPKIFIYEDCHAAFWEQYTPKGEQNAYYYCKELFERLGFDVRVKKRLEDLSDSVTMVVINNRVPDMSETLTMKNI